MMTEADKDFPFMLTVAGVGSGGISAVNHMISNQVDGIKFIAVDTDTTALSNSQAPIHIQIDGKDPNDIQAEIIKSLEGSKVVFIVAEIGVNTDDSRIAAIMAAYSKGLNALTLAAVIRPSVVEDLEKKSALGLKNLRKNADSIITIPINDNFSPSENFQYTNDILKKVVQSILNFVIAPGLVGLDLSDIKLILQNSGETFIGIGEASGEGAFLKATKIALSSSNIKNNITNANSFLINFSSSEILIALSEINEASMMIQDSANSEAEIMWGTSIDENLGENVRVVIFITRYHN